MKRVIELIKRHPLLYEMLRYKLYARYRSIRRKHVFLDIYENNLWKNMFSVSGPGSSLEATEEIRKSLPRLVEQLGAQSFLDVPCGPDLFRSRWMNGVGRRRTRVRASSSIARGHAPEVLEATEGCIDLPAIRYRRSSWRIGNLVSRPGKLVCPTDGGRGTSSCVRGYRDHMSRRIYASISCRRSGCR